jgi:flagellar motor protein MotB
MFGKAALAAVVMGGSLLGGCGVNKKDHEALKQEGVELRERLSSLEQTQSEAAAREAELQRQLQDRDAQLSQLQQQATARPPAGSFGPGPGGNTPIPQEEVFTIAGDVAFASGSATLNSAARRELDSIARTLNSRYGGRPVRVEGHTDSDPIRRSPWGSNDALSQARAEAVMQYLVSKGVDSSRISAVGMGSRNPKGTKPASRRVEIHVSR